MVTRKNPRTVSRSPAQKAVTKKLIAFNRARGRLNKKRAAPKRARKATRTPAQKRATRKLVALNKRRAKPAHRKATRRKSGNWGIRVIVSRPTKHVRWFTGKGFCKRADFAQHPPKRYATAQAAKTASQRIRGRMPSSITSVEISTI